MSAPVLSWPFNALGKRRRTGRHHPPVPQAAARPAAGTVLADRLASRTPRQAPAETPRPGPQSQSFSRSYGSILPTSLIYILLLTRGCTPWRPDAVMSTPRGANKVSPSDFQGPSKAHRTDGRSVCFTNHLTLSPGKPIPG